MRKKTVRELRLNSGWTQERLGYKLNISNKTVSAKELGTRHFTQKEINQVAKCFKVKADSIKVL